MADQHALRCRNITILKDQTLGHGSYGAVYKAKCDQLMCAAKVLHPTIVDPLDPGSGKILQWFRQECDFLNHLRHPHIVQYLGVCRDPDSNLPVLLMELLDSSLTRMLEQSRYPIPFPIQLDLCHDIATAIAYLHSNDIVHRDLSGNNVLVIAGRRAKVTDFGMSKLAGSDRNTTPLTFCPGTCSYMSPESLKEPPRYTEKLDIFSEGVIMIQVCTRKYPSPGPAMKEVQTDDPRSPTGTTQMPVLETERRKEHIDMIEPTHPLYRLAIECLAYREDDRPTADELCQSLAVLKESRDYIETSERLSVNAPEVNRALQRERNQLALQVEEKTREIEAKDQEITNGRRQIDDKDEEIVRLTMQLQEVKQRLTEYKQIETEFQRSEETNQQLRRQNKDLQLKLEQFQRQIQFRQESFELVESETELRWRDGGKAPFKEVRGSQLSIGHVVYYTSDENIFSYDTSTEKWGTLPKCPQWWSSLALVNNLLTMIGGKQSSDFKSTNKLLSLTKRSGGGISKWVEQFPPMPTSRSNSTAVTYRNHLIVAGGTFSDLLMDKVDTVEVLNTDTLAWSTAASLPCPMAYLSATICGDRLYMLGGDDKNGGCRSVFSCSLTELLQSSPTRSNSLSKIFRHSRIWHRCTNTPVYRSTCTTIHGELVAVGGEDDGAIGNKTNKVYMYDPVTRTWNTISQMATARSQCFVTVVEPNQLLVVGGFVDQRTKDGSIEIAYF